VGGPRKEWRTCYFKSFGGGGTRGEAKGRMKGQTQGTRGWRKGASSERAYKKGNNVRVSKRDGQKFRSGTLDCR